jgi:hypothetical protein
VDDDMPRRRRGAKVAAIEAAEERGFLLRMLLHSPKDMIAGVLAAAAVSAIIANAVFLQAGRHPSPMFGAAAPAQPMANPLPRPRPLEASRSIEPPAVEQRAAETKAVEPRPADAMTSLVAKTTTPSAPPTAAPPSAAPSVTVIRPPAPVPVATPQTAAGRRIAAVQRTLTEYGYGQLKPTGTIGAETQAAITKFERDRKLPVTGQMSDRLVKELSTMTGRPVD